jgi:hypothetical protein
MLLKPTSATMPASGQARPSTSTRDEDNFQLVAVRRPRGYEHRWCLCARHLRQSGERRISERADVAASG